MATHIALARPLPPIGAVLLCLELGSTAAYPVTVERHLGRYFFAGGHRFHVYDYWQVGATSHTWRTAAAMAWLASPEDLASLEKLQAELATASQAPWQPPRHRLALQSPPRTGKPLLPTPMLIFCRTQEVHPCGARWRKPLPFGWEIRWQCPNRPIVAVPHGCWRQRTSW